MCFHEILHFIEFSGDTFKLIESYIKYIPIVNILIIVYYFSNLFVKIKEKIILKKIEKIKRR